MQLQDALDRLVKGKPERVKATGRLSLNKINQEAGLGHSYIHKFKPFINDVANPAIEKYNKELDAPSLVSQEASNPEDMSDVDKLKKELSREKNLKKKYANERDDLKEQNKILEGLNKSLMFRVYELQEEFGERVYEVSGHRKK